jgi:hypothetical protein
MLRRVKLLMQCTHVLVTWELNRYGRWTMDDGRRTTHFKSFYILDPLREASENICARLPACQAAWIHQIHAIGGARGFVTMVMVFVRSFVLFFADFLTLRG